MKKAIARRYFLKIGIASLTVSCTQYFNFQREQPMNINRQSMTAEPGRLLARPLKPTGTRKTGLYPLGLDGDRDGLVFIPGSYEPSQPAPLILMLHGAGGDAQGALSFFLPLAEREGVILLGIDSRRQTWDRLWGQFGPDIAFIDKALLQIFRDYAIDPKHFAIAGFSDGASYALSVGLTNGDFFSHIMAFSPGFLAPASLEGQPSLFISHGTNDTVLPIQNCSRKIVRQVQQANYDLAYHEFNGGHNIPPEIVLQALTWFKGN